MRVSCYDVRMTLTPTGISEKGGMTVRLATYNDLVAAEVRAETARRLVSNKAIADHLGVSAMYVSRRMRGETPFDIAELAAIATLIKCDVADFLPSDYDGDPVRDLRRAKKWAKSDSNARPSGWNHGGSVSILRAVA